MSVLTDSEETLRSQDVEPVHRRSTSVAWWIPVLYLVSTILLFERTWRDPTRFTVGTGGDPNLGMWALGWMLHALTQPHGGPFLTNYINYPFGVNLMWNSPLVPQAVLLLPVTGTLGPIVAYNVMITLDVALSAWCGYLACRKFSKEAISAVLGGFVYGFSPYMMSQARDHSTLATAFVPPLMVIVLYDMFVEHRWSALRNGVGLGALAACQLLIAEELLASELLVAGIALVLAAMLQHRKITETVRRVGKAFVIAGATFTVLCIYPVLVQFLGPQGINGVLQQPNVFVTDLTNFVVPTSMQHLAPSWAIARSTHWSGNLSEFNGYLGIPLIAVVLYVAVRHWDSISVRVSVMTGAVVAILSLGPSLHISGVDQQFALPWRLIAALPLVGNLLPARLMVYVDLLGALMIATFVDDLLAVRGRIVQLVQVALLLGVVVTLFPVAPFPATSEQVPRFFTDGSANMIPMGSVVLISPFQQLYPAEPMLWQAETKMRFRIPQGYFIGPGAHRHPTYGAPFSALSESMLDIQGGTAPPFSAAVKIQVMRDLSARKVGTIVVGPTSNEETMLQFFEFIMGEGPESVSDVYVWPHVGQQLSREGT